MKMFNVRVFNGFLIVLLLSFLLIGLVGAVTPALNITLLYPPGDINVTQNEFFNVSVNVCCIDDDCGQVNTTVYRYTGPEKVLNTSLSSLAGQLASLSNKFAEDYTPLTNRLRDVVQIAERIGNV